MRRLNLRVTIQTSDPIVEIIDRNKQNVWLRAVTDADAGHQQCEGDSNGLHRH